MRSLSLISSTAAAGPRRPTRHDAYVGQLVEQVLFTSPGERVNLPDFGSGLLQLPFAPNSVELAAATQFAVQGALQKWLSGYRKCSPSTPQPRKRP